MKTVIAFTLLLASFIAQASAGFTGAFAPSQWAVFAVTGSVTQFTQTGLSITSGNVGSESFTDAIVVPQTGRISFDWVFTTLDDPAFERFGVSVLAPALVFTPLSDESSLTQSGSFSLDVTATSTFAFTAWSLDGFGGPATTVISNFSFESDPLTPVPEPGALALMATGLAALTARRRRRA